MLIKMGGGIKAYILLVIKDSIKINSSKFFIFITLTSEVKTIWYLYKFFSFFTMNSADKFRGNKKRNILS